MKIFLKLYAIFCLYSVSLAQKQNNTSLLKSILTSERSNTLTADIGGSVLTVQQCIGQMGNIGVVSNRKTLVQQGFLTFYEPRLKGKKAIKEINVKPPRIYPNPFSDVLNIYLSQQIVGMLSIGVFDITGRHLFQKKYDPNQSIQVNMNFLQDATYVIQIDADGFKWAMEVIKRRE